MNEDPIMEAHKNGTLHDAILDFIRSPAGWDCLIEFIDRMREKVYVPRGGDRQNGVNLMLGFFEHMVDKFQIPEPLNFKGDVSTDIWYECPGAEFLPNGRKITVEFYEMVKDHTEGEDSLPDVS